MWSLGIGDPQVTVLCIESDWLQFLPATAAPPFVNEGLGGRGWEWASVQGPAESWFSSHMHLGQLSVNQLQNLFLQEGLCSGFSACDPTPPSLPVLAPDHTNQTPGPGEAPCPHHPSLEAFSSLHTEAEST